MNDPIIDTPKVVQILQESESSSWDTNTTPKLNGGIVFQIPTHQLTSSIQKLEAKKSNDESLIKRGISLLSSGFTPKSSNVSSPLMSARSTLHSSEMNVGLLD
eukprot:TRINITY_DN4097_c0_g1_i8.p2 TRINITY_DN4097_c0_g1~~TRINITY_DN4097_c0_g1_i8.p2  ORF type:complete len:103 (-),score=28.78 TRINITY_DN4097_c0_g1_i8:2240-2548(-)